MSESDTRQFYVVSPFKLAGGIVKPSSEPISIPADQVDELRLLNLISDQPPGSRTAVASSASDDEKRDQIISLELQIGDSLHRRAELEDQEAIARHRRDGAIVEAEAAEARRDAAIAEADAAEARRDAAIADAKKAESPITILYEAGAKGGVLLGSDSFPAQIRIGDVDVALGELVAAAAAGLVADAAWNDLAQSDRDAAIQAEIDRRSAPPAAQAKAKSDKPKR
ncbi:hypothetical protein RDV84_00190 [Lysobacter yananisis]|uniref:Uncharacterized protein n=1 Tax=Lysobacter yananisis TaxID=1003114 RepID=A0ABY9PAD0_9GAMM|nr:hypothetical protein [Lysobacter yananisis]WMT03309.1 hypothetical protein RDV84_00190 [Lysobacter yananisis]